MRAAVVVVLAILVAAGGVLVWRSRATTSAASKQVAAGVPRDATKKERLYLAIPMGIFVPVSKVMDQFQAKHPEVEFMTMVDTPEAMVQAVETNADKPDVFMSPGGHEALVLVEKGFLDPKTLVAFGSYELAVLVPKENPGKVSKLEDLLNPGVKVISLSDPDLSAPCYAARQSLQNLGLWDKVQKKVKVTGCCMESFNWILDGRAQANIQFLGCPLDPKTAQMSSGDKVAIACTFPTDTFYTPRNVVGVLTTTKQRKLAEEFVSFLTSPDTIKFMAANRLRNDQNLPLTPGPWGPEQERSPVGKAVAVGAGAAGR